jgi:phosphoesterase RecJ-like protein
MFAHEIFRGGGHANASGGELYGTVGQAVRMFERNMGKYLKRD